MYDHYYSSCQGGAYKRGWPGDDRDDGLRFIKKNIAVNHHSILFKVTEERIRFNQKRKTNRNVNRNTYDFR